jgi:hypothetical protein
MQTLGCQGDNIVMLENESLQKMTSSVSYLLANDGLPQREYMRKAAVDGIITYSYSDENFLYKEPAGSKRWTDSFTTENPLRADKEQSMWIDKIFSYLDSITGVSFQRKDGSRGEIHLNFVPTNTNKYFKGDFTNGYEIDAVENVQWTGGLAFYNGYGQMYSFHNRKQYGGLDDIRDIQRAILESLGLTPPEGDANNPKYSWDNTLLSNNTGGLNSAGATFFMSSDDKAAVEELLGAGEIAFAPKKVKVHSQKYKEELMIGLEGVIDVFKIRSKGMILKVDEGTQYDDIGVIINNYNVPYIANFNPYEGDRIEIHRSLLDPKSPQDNGSKKLAKHFKKTKLKFEHIFGDIYNKNKNIYYNDAGKLIVDTNGIKEGVMSGSNKAGLNSQILAFVDPVGPETNAFSGNWLSFFG